MYSLPEQRPGLVADIAAVEQRLAAAVAARDEAEVVMGIRRGEGLGSDHPNASAAGDQRKDAEGKIDFAMMELRTLEAHLSQLDQRLAEA